MSRGALSHFSLEELDLHIDPASTWQALYQHVTASHITRPMLGTQIWWAQSHNNEERCLKEFFIADPQTYYRQLPSPRWHELKQLSHLSGTQRGLSPQRAELYNRLVDGSLKEEIKEQGPAQHFFFRNLFNVYSFEVEALITQFAMRYGCDRLVQTYGWGPLYLPQRPSYRYVIEMERLDELEAPAPGDYLNIVHRLIEMMAAVTQLHSMLVPLYAYPPEIVREMIHTPYVQLTRPFHYDLSPDQFMCRRGQQGAPDKVILIDFNASRMAETEYSDFSWKTIPGKDYYQPPERRAQASSALEEVTFRSNPIYDLYAILVIGLFYLRRQDLQCKRIQDIPRWNDIAYFYQEIQSSQLAEQLYQQISNNKGVQPQALISLMTAAFQSNPQEREDQLQRIPPLKWRGTSDWMLLPKAMDLLARNCMQRQFRVQWLSDRIQIPQSHTPQSISTYMDMPSCHWQAGPFEEGRLHHPDFSPEACFFFQEDNNLPFVKEGQLLPHTTGTFKVYASFAGCVDFANPLQIEIVASRTNNIEHQIQGFAAPVAQPTLLEPARTILDLQHPGLEGSDFAPITSPPQTPAPETGVFQREDAWTPAPQQVHTPPPVDASNGTGFFNRDAHISTPPPPTTPKPADESEGTGLFNRDEHIPSAASVQLSSHTDIDIRSLMREAHGCSYTERLDEIDDIAKRHFDEIQCYQLFVNTFSRRCQLALEKNQLTPSSKALQALADLLESPGATEQTIGLLLNNLAICSYQSAFQQQLHPRWEQELGFDPCVSLERWLHRTDPENTYQHKGRLWEIRARARETIDYCRKIKRSDPA